MSSQTTIEVPIKGMDCIECTQHVQHAIAALPGVATVAVFLTSEKATIRFDPSRVDMPAIRRAVAAAGYSVPTVSPQSERQSIELVQADVTRRVTTLLAIVFGAVLFVVVIGEWLGLFAQLTARVPFVVGLVVVIVSGYPIFANVIRAALKRQVIAHTLMSIGVVAALAVGQWATAAVVVFFMRVGDYAENFTTERARCAS